MMRGISFVFIIVFAVCFPEMALSFTKEIGNGYCAIRHPVEFVSSEGATCESQHVIQQQSGGGDGKNTVWINTTLHTYLDRSSCKPWESERPTFSIFGDNNIERAYMMGVWVNSYHYMVYDHHGSGTLTLIEWDGASHLLYMVSSVFNFPQKELNYFTYQIERFQNGQKTQFIDAVIGIPIDFFELAVGVVYSAVGVVVGTIINPFDTLRNVVSLVTLGITSLIKAVWLLFEGILSLFTLGWIGGCG